MDCSWLPFPDHRISNFEEKCGVLNWHYYLQRAVTPDWMGITVFFSRVEKPSEAITQHYFDEYERVKGEVNL
jgi:hypothetical protein